MHTSGLTVPGHCAGTVSALVIQPCVLDHCLAVMSTTNVCGLSNHVCCKECLRVCICTQAAFAPAYLEVVDELAFPAPAPWLLTPSKHLHTQCVHATPPSMIRPVHTLNKCSGMMNAHPVQLYKATIRRAIRHLRTAAGKALARQHPMHNLVLQSHRNCSVRNTPVRLALHLLSLIS